MILSLIGPTASGKSAVALELAQKMSSEIINADSRQIYKYLDEGTSKPTQEDRKKIPHHLYDFINPDQPYNAGEYARQASKVMNDIVSRKKIPIVTGGTGLYVKALFMGLSALPERNEEVRKKLHAFAEEKGRKALHEMLEKADPASAMKIPHQNIQRVVRALEVYELTKKPLSEHHQESKSQGPEIQPIQIGILWDREDLKERIRERTQKIAPHIVRETEKLIKMGFQSSDPGCQSLGYKQAFLLLDKKMSQEDFESSLLTDTSQYAKRQMTWFGRDTTVRWIKPSKPFAACAVADQIFNILSQIASHNQ